MAVNLGKNIKLCLLFFEIVIVFRGQDTHIHQPKTVLQIRLNYLRKWFFFSVRVRNVCVCAIVIRRRHHGTKHETKRNKIILWH